jgi:hypothetical protein
VSSGVLELARGRESGVDPDGDSDMGTETGVRKEVGSSGGSGYESIYRLVLLTHATTGSRDGASAGKRRVWYQGSCPTLFPGRRSAELRSASLFPSYF